jgi:hypothetical protein
MDNVRHEVGRTFMRGMRKYLKDKTDEVETNSNNKNA